MKILRLIVACAAFLSLLSASALAQTTWIGTVSTAWNTAGNWSPAAVPISTTNVIIATATNQPSTYVVSPVCNNLTIQAGATLTLGGGFDLTVNGNLQITGTLTVTSATSQVSVTGNWTNDNAFTHGGSTVNLGGTGGLGGTSSTTFNNLLINGGTRSATTAFTAAGEVAVEGGALLDIGSVTHLVAGNWTTSRAGGSVSGSGTIEFTSDGQITTGTFSVPNVKVSSGIRSVNETTVAGNLELTGGQILILDNATLSVNGNATLTAGTLGWTSTFAGLETLDVEGNVTCTASAGSTSADARFLCGGNWSSSSAFAPAAGLVDLNGAGTTTLSGATPTFADLRVINGTRNMSSASVVTGSLTIASGAALNSTAALDVDGSVTLGNASAAWALGASTHSVGGNWTSSGGSATGTGTVVFDGTGTLATGGGSIANMGLSSGTRSVSNAIVGGDLVQTGGTLHINNDQILTVNGSATLSAPGTVEWHSTGNGTLDSIDVAGSVTVTAAAGTTTADSRLFCAGNWSSSSAFSMAAGQVVLDGGTAATVGGTGTTFPNLTVASGTKTFQSATLVTVDVSINTGATLDADAALDVNGKVTLGAAAAWDLGAFTHTVAGNYTSSGGNATGAGMIDFDGAGTVGTSTGSISNLRSSAGTRSVNATTVTGNLTLAGGTLHVNDNQSLTVGGNAAFNTGTLEWHPTSDGLLDVIDVAGNVTVTATAGTTSADSRVFCAGNWSSSGAFTPASGRVILDGGTVATVSGPGTTFSTLIVSSGTKTFLAATLVAGNLDVFAGATLDANAALDVNGSVTLGTATATWDLGAFTHTVGGTWTSSGGSATGTGTILMDGPGTVGTASGSIPNLQVSAGPRLVNTSTVTGDLTHTAGTLFINDDQVLTVGGNANFTAGTLGWQATPDGVPDTIDVAGNVTVTAAAGTTSADSRLFCGGNWSSSSAFAPAAGVVLLDGGSVATVGGAGTTLASLTIDSGTKTVLTAVLVAGNLVVSTGATLDADAALDVNGNVTLGAATATWDLGALTHTVGGNWTSTGGSATGAGTVLFDGAGTLATSTGSIPNVTSSTGTRNVNSSTVTGTLSLTGGTLHINDDQTLAVNGSASLTAGTLEWHGAVDGVSDILDVAGNVTVTAAAGTTTSDSRLFCAGNWSSSSAFAPASGIVVLDGGTTTTVSGAGLTLAGLNVSSGVKTVQSAALVGGNLVVLTGATLDADAAMDVNGNVTLGTASSSWDIGSLTHTVGGTWASAGGAAIGTGTIQFDGAGDVETLAGSIPNVTVSAGTRTVGTTTVTGNLSMTGGGLAIRNDKTLTVNGNLSLTAGTVSWFGAVVGGLEVIDVQGNVTVQVPVVSESTSSRLLCAGNWSADATFVPALGRVVFDGGSVATIGSTGFTTIHFGNVEVASGSKTQTAVMQNAGQLLVASGATLTLGAGLTTQDVDVVSGTLALGSQTLTASRHWISSAVGSTVSGTGLIVFTAAGNLSSGANTIPSVKSQGGVRTVSTTSISGTLELTGGTLTIADNQTLSVSGDATLSAGTLALADSTAGVETLDVNGNVSLSAAAGAHSANSRIFCGGNWTSPGSYAPALGLVTLDGAGSTSVSGAGLNLADLKIAAGTKTLSGALETSNLELSTGAAFVSNAAVDVNGAVVLGGVTASWDLGGLTHTVSGNWTSGGASASNGSVIFDGSGSLATGAGSIAAVTVSTGSRTASNSAVSGNLALTGGTLQILDDQTLSVGGNASLTAGTLSWTSTASGGQEVLDVEGDVTCTATAGLTSANSLLRCAGDWASNSSFAPAAGTVELDGAAASLFSGASPGFNPAFRNLTIKNGARTAGNSSAVTASSITITSTGAWRTDNNTLTLANSPIAVQGTLAVEAGGTLALGAPTVLSVTPTGTLSVIGTTTQTATVTGFAGGGYLASVDGTLAASHFLFEQMGASGIVVNATASLGAFPNDLRGGTFSNPSSAANSVLLDIRRATATDIRYVDFEDPLSVGTFNVRTLSGAAITFTNSGGDFTGPSFEQDPFALVNWVANSTTLVSFTATAGENIVNLAWQSSIEVDIDKYLVQRATNVNGPYTDLAEVTATGPGNYAYPDGSVVPLQTYFFRIAERLTHGHVAVLGQTAATAWPSGPPANFLTVGASGEFPDVQSALASVLPASPVVSIAAGTYPAFTVGPGFVGTLRILADGSGPVIITTTAGPVTIQNLGSSASVELSDLTIGSLVSAHPGVVVQSCTGIVVLDELTVHGGVAQPGISANASTKVAIQRTVMDGVPGLLVDATSKLVASRGSLDDLEVKGTSHVRLCQLTTVPTVQPGSTLIQLTGVMPDVDVPELSTLGETFTMTLQGEPSGTWFLIASLNMSWLDQPSPPWAMVGIANLGAALITISGPMGPGTISFPAALPADGVIFGLPFVLQTVVVHPVSHERRWSNVASIIGTS